MGVKEQMIGILLSNETSRVRFSFTGTSGATISVDPASFRRVADGLRSNKLNVVEGRFDTNIAMYSAHADATKDVAANTFYLGRNPRSSRIFNALVVHESVHAAFDLDSTSLPWIDNEAAAFIAQAYYARNSGLPRQAFDSGSQPNLAYMVVEGLRSDNSSDVAWFLKELRDSLNASPLYHSYIRDQFRGDG